MNINKSYLGCRDQLIVIHTIAKTCVLLVTNF